MSHTDLIVKGCIGALFCIFVLSFFVFFAGGVVRMVSDGRVSQVEDTEFADIDCSKISTAKGHRLNGEACNVARARKGLSTPWLVLYDSSVKIEEIYVVVKTVLVRNIFLVLLLMMLGFGAAFYYYRTISRAFATLMPKQKAF